MSSLNLTFRTLDVRLLFVLTPHIALNVTVEFLFRNNAYIQSLMKREKSKDATHDVFFCTKMTRGAPESAIVVTKSNNFYIVVASTAI